MLDSLQRSSAFASAAFYTGNLTQHFIFETKLTTGAAVQPRFLQGKDLQVPGGGIWQKQPWYFKMCT